MFRPEKPKVRYSEMDAAAKATFRQEERAGRKEKDRVVRYFVHSQTTLNSAASGGLDGGADVGMISALLDGLHTEVAKIVKKEEDREILRVAAVCRALETAVSMSSLAQLESLCYVLLGSYVQLMKWPTASYLVETLFAAVYHTLSQTDEFSAPATDGKNNMSEVEKFGVDTLGPRDDGMPNIAELSLLVAEEIGDSMLELMMDQAGSRALRSMLKIFSGIPIRGVGGPATGATGDSSATEESPVLIHFPRALDVLVRGVSKCIEDNGGWVSCATTMCANTVTQGLVEVCSVSEAVANTVKPRVQSALPHLMNDGFGVYVVQAYLAVRCRWRSGSSKEDKEEEQTNKNKKNSSGGSLSEDQIWWHAAWRCLKTRVGDVIQSCGSPNCLDADAVAGLLGNLACYAPTVEAFEDFLDSAILPYMEKKLIVNPQLFPAVLRSLQKCTAMTRVAELIEQRRAGKDTSKETKNMITVVFSVPLELKRKLLNAIHVAVKTKTNKGVAQYMLVDCQQSVHSQTPDTVNPPSDPEYQQHKAEQKAQVDSRGHHHVAPAAPTTDSRGHHHVAPAAPTTDSRGHHHVAPAAPTTDSRGHHHVAPAAPTTGHHHVAASAAPLTTTGGSIDGRVVHNVGPEIMAELLRLKEVVPCLAAQSFSRLGINDFLAVMMDPQGARVVQQYITFLSQAEAKVVHGASAGTSTAAPVGQSSAAAASSSSAAANRSIQSQNNKRGKRARGDEANTSAAPAATEEAPSAQPSKVSAQDMKGGLSRFHRRIETHIVSLCCNKYSSYVIQHLYDCSPFLLKECLNKLLKTFVKELKQDFFGCKVLEQCHVESYMWRYDEWKKVSERQSQVKRMMAQILSSQI